MNEGLENRREIRLNFIDFVMDHSIEDDWFYKNLSKHYKIIQSENPDYLLSGGLGHRHIDHRYDRCVKIMVTGENYTPDFNLFDYCIAFDHLDFGDRYIRQPLFCFYPEFEKLRNRTLPTDEHLLNRKFCSFIVSNRAGDPLRLQFFEELSKYKPVSSGGRLLNNVGGPVADKEEFCAAHKFNIAFENSSAPGYTTEKIMQAYASNTVPIYYGDPTVETDFRPQSMVRIRSQKDFKDAIEQIEYLDTHDDAYLKMVHEQCLVHPVEWWEDRMTVFFRHIFDQPIDQAKRLIPYGNQAKYRARNYRVYKVDDAWRNRAIKVYRFLERMGVKIPVKR